MITVFGVPNVIHCNGGAYTTCVPEPTFPFVQMDRNPLLGAAVSPLTSCLIICSDHKPRSKRKELSLFSGLVNVLGFQPFQLMRVGKRLFVETLLRHALTPSEVARQVCKSGKDGGPTRQGGQREQGPQ